MKLNENVFELLAADFMYITVWETVKQTVNYLKHISNGNVVDKSIYRHHMVACLFKTLVAYLSTMKPKS